MAPSPSDQISGKPGGLVHLPPPCCPSSAEAAPGGGLWGCVKGRRSKTYRKEAIAASSAVPWAGRLSRASLLRDEGGSIHSPGPPFLLGPYGCAPVEGCWANLWAIQHWECPSLNLRDFFKERERENQGEDLKCQHRALRHSLSTDGKCQTLSSKHIPRES